MNIQKKDLPQGQKEIIVELTDLELSPFITKATETIANQVKIPGFRPGKANYDIVKNQVGEMKIYQEAAEKAIAKTLDEIIKKENLPIVGQPEINIEKLAPGNNFIYHAKIYLLPEVVLPVDKNGDFDFSEIKIKKEKVEIKEEAINKTIERLQKNFRKESLKNGAIEKTDKAIIDFEIKQNKVPIENGQYQNFSVLVGENLMIPGFEDQLLGLKKDDKKEFVLAFPETYFKKDLAGKNAEFFITVKDVYQTSLPELNDDFAKSLGKFTDLIDLKNKIKENLTLEEEMKKNQKMETEIFDKLIVKTTFGPIPQNIIEQEKHSMVHELEHSIEHEGLKWADYLANIKKTEEELEKEFNEPAEKRIKMQLIVREIMLKNKITADNAEIEHEIEETLKLYPQNEEAEKNIKSDLYRHYIENIIINRKVIEYIKTKVGNSL